MTHPLALVIYNRPEHLRQVMEALAPQKPEPLYIFADGPMDEVAVKEARDMAWNMANWTDRRLLLGQPKNLGLAASIINAVDQAMKYNDTVIILEDDCVPGPHFMAFMDECLKRYKDDPKVLCCTGYTVNIPDDLKQAHDWDVYFMPRTETWGWATWRHKWRLYRRDVGVAYREALQRRVDLAAGGPDVPGMIEDRVDNKSDSWSPGWMLAAYLNDMYCAFPMTSHIQNIGVDGSGRHCGQSEIWKTEIATEKPTRFPKGFIKNKAIEDYVREYHAHY